MCPRSDLNPIEFQLSGRRSEEYPQVLRYNHGMARLQEPDTYEETELAIVVNYHGLPQCTDTPEQYVAPLRLAALNEVCMLSWRDEPSGGEVQVPCGKVFDRNERHALFDIG